MFQVLPRNLHSVVASKCFLLFYASVIWFRLQGVDSICSGRKQPAPSSRPGKRVLTRLQVAEIDERRLIPPEDDSKKSSGGRQQPEPGWAFLLRDNCGVEWRHGGKIVSDGTSVMSDGTSIMSDAKTAMRDGHKMSKQGTYLPCIDATRYQSSEVSGRAAGYWAVRYRGKKISGSELSGSEVSEQRSYRTAMQGAARYRTRGTRQRCIEATKYWTVRYGAAWYRE